MQSLLNYLLHLPATEAWILFFAENILIAAAVLCCGHIILQRQADVRAGYSGYRYTRREWMLCSVTITLNTVVTYAGWWAWKAGIILIDPALSWAVAADFVLLFFAMDLLMYVFHYVIHKTFLYTAVHQLHHASIDPTPIDLFVLHPVETLGFGTLWLVLLALYPFNVYAIALYLTANIIFGLAGHLGMEPLPATWREKPVLKYLGTSTFHHQHHRDKDHNFGFYTNVWDRIFKTLGAS